MKRRTIVIIAVLALAPALWIGFSKNPNPAFVAAVKNTDKIVIRNGGFDCCGNDVDSQKILFETSDPKLIAEINSHITFQRRTSLFTMSRCRCCGYPGIDWYKNDKRIALTGLQHGWAMRWSGFETDENLTYSSAAWFSKFLKQQGIPEDGPAHEPPEYDGL